MSLRSDPQSYHIPNGIFRREHGQTPNGNEFGGCWVLRDADGVYVDHDQYRHDLASRNGINLPCYMEALLA